MEGFQKLVLISAIIILIIALVFMGMVLSSAHSQEWPPLVSECPDWWIVDGSGNNTKCINVKDLGVCSPHSDNNEHQQMDFNLPAFTGSNGTCAKYSWANKCKVSWDGITYGVENPCATTTTTTV
jgi:hypothetical protein